MQTLTDKNKKWGRLVAILAVMTVFSGCELRQDNQYRFYGLDANTFRVVINNDTSRNLLAVADAVAAGFNVDQILRGLDINATCPNPGTRSMGDSCAQRILDSIEVTGWLAVVGNPMWNNATRPAETSDIARDGLDLIRAHPSRCMEVVLDHWVTSFSSDWQTQRQGEQGCLLPKAVG